MLSRHFLERRRRKAIRDGIWFTAIDRIERGILALTIRTVDVVRSRTLSSEVVKILVKLREALKSGFVRRVEKFGFERAKNFASQAVKWGYSDAKSWILDVRFAQYLTIVELNRPTSYGI